MKYTIKPLEWGFKRARAINVFYEIVTRNKGEQLVIRAGAGGLIQSKTCHRDVKSAQSAAEADWQARIKEALEPVQDWISVEERLPEEGVDVLVTNGFAVWQGEYRAKCWWDGDGDWLIKETITHWQPMPKPPKEAQG